MHGQSLNPLLLSLLVASVVLTQLACLEVEAREMPLTHEAPSATTPWELKPAELTPPTTITPVQPPMAESIPPPEVVYQLSNPNPEAVASLGIPELPTPDASDSADSAPTAAAVAAAAAAGVVVEAAPVCTIPEGLAIVDIPLPPREPDTAATATATPEVAPSADPTGATPMATVATPIQYAANLQAHNAYRAMHASTGALSWDTVVAASAAARAAKCIWDHEANIAYGENLYASSVYSDAARQQLDGIKAWYREVAAYGYNAPGFSLATGHFTQVVWTTSTLLGCAVQSCPNGLVGWSAGRFLMVCRYSPPGNYVGEFGTKVKPVLATTLAQATTITSGSTCKASPSNVYSLCQRSNGRLELMRSGSTTPLWRSTTTTLATGTYKMTVETTGRLTVKNSAGAIKWSSNAANPSGRAAPYRLLVQNNGNVQLVDSRSALVWQTNTVQ